MSRLRTRSSWLLLVVWLLTSAARADVILEWNDLMMAAIRTDNSGPTLSTRNLAILHTAIFDAVNSVTRTHQPYKFQPETPEGTSAEAAAVSAAYGVARVLYPPLNSRIEELYRRHLAAAEPNEALTNGLTLGRKVATLALAARSADRSNTDVPYIPSNQPGAWRRTPPFMRPPLTPHWRYVTPFCLPVVEPFLPPPPPALDSKEYAESLNEVKAIGGKDSKLRTAEQGETAVFWSDFSYTVMPPGHWHEITATIVRNQGASLADNARLFALVSLAQADAAIVCWEAKFRHNLWRPITAVRRAAEDNNPDTEPDAAWDHLLASPPFPAYPSGHSTFSKACSQVLTRFFGTDAVTFTARSDSLPGVVRTYHSLSACADEVGMSRIYGGIHFPFDNVEGKKSGGRVGDFIIENFLLPNDRLPSLVMDPCATNGIPCLRLHGRLGTQLVLEASTNRARWTPVSTNAAAIGGVVVAANNAESHFYRVKAQ
jgi:hypothetical protein